MQVRSSRAALATLIACAAACTSPADQPIAPTDAALPVDAAADAALDTPIDAALPPDAPPDAPPPLDADHDGHPAGADCDDDDPAVWQLLAYGFRDADVDGHTVEEAGLLCSGAQLPPGYASSPSPGAPDCDDADPASFTVVLGFLDVDSDGVGTGMAMALCTAGALPAGFAATGGDCAQADPARWIDRPYSFRDADGDGRTVAESGLVCSGAMLPPGYRTSAPVGVPPDCNDADPGAWVTLTVFADFDLDGFGSGPSQLACTNGSPPAGFSTAGTDCADDDAAVWVSRSYVAVDFDGDGFTRPMMGVRCTAGALLPPYYATQMGNDCDDADPGAWASLTIFADLDGDGFGAGPSQVACTDGAAPDGFSLVGTDCDDTDEALTRMAVLYPDTDGDGVGAPPRQILCIGSDPPDGFAAGGYDDADDDPGVIEDEDADEELDLILSQS